MSTSTPIFNYPSVRREEVKEEKFNVEVKDHYRYLEDPESEETKKFVESQNVVSSSYIDACPRKQMIKEILTKAQDYRRQGCFFKRCDKYYMFKNIGLQPQSVLYQKRSVEGEEKIFFDPNKLSEDGTVALNQISFSPNCKYFAYGTSTSGSDWVEIRIIEMATGEELYERLVRAKFTSITWTHDDKGFFYAMYPSHKGPLSGTSTERNEFHSIYYHKVFSTQREDILKVNFPDRPNWRLSCEISDDGKQLHVYAREGCDDCLWYYCNLADFKPSEKLTLRSIFDKLEGEFKYITNNGSIVYFMTNVEAKNYRICKLDLNRLSMRSWVDIIPNHPTDVLGWAECYTVQGVDYLVVEYTRNVISEVEIRHLDTGEIVKKLEFPQGTITKISGRRDHDEIFFHYSSFISPGRAYYFNLNFLHKEPYLVIESRPKGFKPDEYQIEQVFYDSIDGTKIPMFLVHRKDLVRDGNNPCILYGYGGFNLKITPGFNINRVAWYKHFKGILAVANIRGGGEFGQEWHDGGRLFKKQNCFDDFCSAAEYLIENKYTKPEKLAIEGGSNGGLLVAACSNQKPNLFGACICHVGVLDMIRYIEFTIGDAWASDYGDPNEREHFHNLLSYSPYHNIPSDATRYPATLLLTADQDDRVVPAHSLKFIAELQHKLGKRLSDTPLMIRIDASAGHGGGKPTAKVIDEYTDIYSFLYNSLQLAENFSEAE